MNVMWVHSNLAHRLHGSLAALGQQGVVRLECSLVGLEAQVDTSWSSGGHTDDEQVDDVRELAKGAQAAGEREERGVVNTCWT